MITVIVLYNDGNRIDNGDFILYGLLSDLHQARSQPSTDIKLSAILQSGVSKDNAGGASMMGRTNKEDLIRVPL